MTSRATFPRPSPSLFAVALLAAVTPSGSLAAHGAVFLPPQPSQQPEGYPVTPLPGPTGPNGYAGPTAPLSGINQVPVLPSYTEWSWWWEFNREPLLDLRSQIYADATTSGSDGFYLGHGAKKQARHNALMPTDEDVKNTVVPALIAALKKEKSNDVLSGTIVALAKIGASRGGAMKIEIEALLKPYLADKSQEVAETAAAALGILGNESSAFLLSEILLDTSAGRDAVRASEVPSRTRAFAAYGLGLLGHRSEREDVRRYVVHKLAWALREDRARTPDLGVACVIAMGRVPLPPRGVVPDPKERARTASVSSLETQLLFLLDYLRRERNDRLVRAHVPTSLALLVASADEFEATTLGDEVVGELIKRAGSERGETREMRQGCAMALGLVGDDDADALDQRIRSTLLDRFDDADKNTRHFAMISAAQVAARRGLGAPEGETQVRERLLRMLARGRSDTARWSAMALATLERSRSASGRGVHPDSSRALRAFLEDARAPIDVGAAAIACGIARDREAEEALRSRIDVVRDDQAKGQVAVALGLIDSRGSIDLIRRLLEDATYRPELLREAAIALGLLGDRDTVSALIAKLERANSLSAQASIAQALGRIGDARALEPLVEMISSGRRTSSARAFAAVALGLVAEKDALPWSTVLAVGTNYAAAPPTLYDALGAGILNIL